MFKHLSVYILVITLIAVAVLAFFISVTNDNLQDSFAEHFLQSKKQFIDHYFEEEYMKIEGIILTNAIWTDAYDAVVDGDREWVVENITEHIVDAKILGYDSVMLSNEEGSFVVQDGNLSMSMHALASYRKIIDDNVMVREMISHNGQWYLVAGRPISREGSNDAQGAFMIAKALGNNFAELHDMLSSEGVDSTDIFLAPSSDMKGSYQLEYTLPHNQDTQTLYFVFKVSALTQLLSSQRDLNIVLILVVFFVMVVSILYVFQRGNDKISRITENIEEISSGNYHVKIPVQRRSLLPELEVLSKSINHMSTEIERHIIEIDQRYADMVDVLVDTVEMKDRYTYHHSVAVADYALLIGRAIDFDDLANLELAAKLHDVGKISISIEILNKPGPLTDEEYEIVKTHSEKGAELLSGISYFQVAANAILYHHERVDGLGYPMGLSGDEIPLMSQIITIADAFDAMTSDRSYRKAMDMNEAMKILEKDSGTMFNTYLVNVFCRELRNRFE